MNFPIPWQERLCRSLRGTRKERRNRYLRVSLLGTLFKQVKVIGAFIDLTNWIYSPAERI